MTDQDASPRSEVSQDPVEIPQDNAISIHDARAIAAEESVTLGKSTLQRWAKHWAEQGSHSQVRSILVTTRSGTAYRLDRDDFTAWLLDQKRNGTASEILQDPARPHETSRDPMRSHEVSRDPARSDEVSRSTFNEPNENDTAALTKLRDENLNLKIDLEVRKQLLSQAASEYERQRSQTENLLRENGALQLRVQQLGAGDDNLRLRVAEPQDRSNEPQRGGYDQHVDMREDGQQAGL